MGPLTEVSIMEADVPVGPTEQSVNGISVSHLFLLSLSFSLSLLPV